MSSDQKAALWTMVGVFVVFKLATTAMIVANSPDIAGATIWFFADNSRWLRSQSIEPHGTPRTVVTPCAIHSL